MNDDLPEMLHRAVDDHLVEAPDLLPRARAARRRRVGGAVAAGVAVLALGAVGVSQLLPTGGTPVALPADTAPATGSPVPVDPSENDPSAPTDQVVDPDAPVPHDVIVERCMPQLDSYRAVPQRFYLLPDDGYVVAHTDREYRVGDPVTLYAGMTNTFTCLLPGEGEVVEDAVDALRPTLDDPRLVAGLCSEQQWEPHGVHEADPAARTLTFEGDDLREAELVLGDELDGFVMAVLALDGEHYACSLAPEDSDVGPRGVRSLGTPDAWDHVTDLTWWTPSEVLTASGVVGKSIVDGDDAYYFTGFVAPPQVRTVEVTGDIEGTIDVRDDQLFVRILKGEASGEPKVAWTALDADGGHVAEGVA